MSFRRQRSGPLERIAIGWTPRGVPRTYRLSRPGRMHFLARLWRLI